MSDQVRLSRRTKSLRLRSSTREQQTRWLLRAAGDLASVERSSRAARHAIPVIYQYLVPRCRWIDELWT